MKKYSFLLTLSGIAVLGICIRFFLLSQIPFGYYFDEMDYIFTGEAIARFGTDISGTWSPFSLHPLQLINNISELASVVHAIVQKIFGFGPKTGHLPSALFGLFSASLVSYISYVLSRKKEIALAVLATVLVSPWHVYISRVSYEGVISLSFQLVMILGFILFLQKEKVSSKQHIFFSVLTVIGAFMGYYTYHGAKFTVLTVGLVLIGYTLWKKRKSAKQALFFSVPILLLLTSMVIHSQVLRSQGYFGNRSSELIFNQTELSKQVDEYRKKSISFPGKQYLISKPTIFFEKVVKRYFNVFDIYQWGVTGEENLFQFSLFVHGFIYLSSIPLAVLGVRYFWKKHRDETLLLLLTIAVAPVTNVLSNFSSQSIFRSALVYALGLVFVGTGIFVVFKQYFKAWLVLIPILILEVLFFAVMFFGRYPIVATDTHFFHEHQVAAFLQHVQKPVVIITSDSSQSYTLARSIIYFNQWMPELTEQERQQFSNLKGPYQFHNITITEICPDTLDTDATVLIWGGKVDSCDIASVQLADYYGNHPEEVNEVQHISFAKKGLGSPLDSRIYFAVYNDTVCDISKLQRYVYQDSIQKFDMMKLDAETFCSTWMLRE